MDMIKIIAQRAQSSNDTVEIALDMSADGQRGMHAQTYILRPTLKSEQAVDDAVTAIKAELDTAAKEAKKLLLSQR